MVGAPAAGGSALCAATGAGAGGSADGRVMVVGGGIAGMQAALDLAASGYYVYLVERKSAIGGVMAGLDKTFPTNDCPLDRLDQGCGKCPQD